MYSTDAHHILYVALPTPSAHAGRSTSCSDVRYCLVQQNNLNSEPACDSIVTARVRRNNEPD